MGIYNWEYLMQYLIKTKTLKLIIIFMMTFLMFGFIENLTRSIVDIVLPEYNYETIEPFDMFYASLHYDYPEARKGLDNMNAVVQSLLGVPLTNSEFYYSYDNAFSDKVKDTSAVFDLSTNTIYYNLKRIDFSDWQNYKQLVIDINIKRLEYLSNINALEGGTMTTEDVRLKKLDVDNHLAQVELLINSKGVASENMDEWLETKAHHPYIQHHTNIVKALADGIFMN